MIIQALRNEGTTKRRLVDLLLPSCLKCNGFERRLSDEVEVIDELYKAGSQTEGIYFDSCVSWERNILFWKIAS